MKKLLTAMLLLIATALLVSGCAGKVTGGGWLPSASDDGKANFGFCVATNCEGGTCPFTYHDKKEGVRIKGRVNLIYVIDSTYRFEGIYYSQNPKIPVSGFIAVIVTDVDPSKGSDGLFEISLTGGPNPGYHNSGELGGGTIKAHPGEDRCE